MRHQANFVFRSRCHNLLILLFINDDGDCIGRFVDCNHGYIFDKYEVARGVVDRNNIHAGAFQETDFF